MSLKEQVNSMRTVMSGKACNHGYELTQVIPVLYSYIAELESALEEAKKPAPKKPAPKKAPAKKAPAKKAPAKKKTSAKKKS